MKGYNFVTLGQITKKLMTAKPRWGSIFHTVLKFQFIRACFQRYEVSANFNLSNNVVSPLQPDRISLIIFYCLLTELRDYHLGGNSHHDSIQLSKRLSGRPTSTLYWYWLMTGKLGILVTRSNLKCQLLQSPGGQRHNHYLSQGRHAMPGVCLSLSLCLSVCKQFYV